MIILMAQILIAIGAALLGFFLFRNPSLAIELQRKFYEGINWRMEPISMTKEIRNTKAMGLFLVVIAVFMIAYAAYCIGSPVP